MAEDTIAGPSQKTKIDRMQAENFWSKVNKDGPIPTHMPQLGACWIWTGRVNKAGYGQYGSCGAHRVAWELTNGAPGESFVCHHCDNPPCCNPSHLFLGTHYENQLDAMIKRHQRRAALTPAIVHEIRQLKDQPIHQVARKYGLKGREVARIFSGAGCRRVVITSDETQFVSRNR